jgi:hypothetical protein
MGSPIIKALPIDAFVYGVAIQTASDRSVVERLKKNMGVWRAAAIILAVVIAVSIVL